MTPAASPEKEATGAVVFIGRRSLHSEGMYRLTAVYAASRRVPLFHVEGGDGVLPPHPVSLVVCCPPCGSGFPDRLALLLDASRFRAERVMVYLDGRYPYHERTARLLFPCPSVAVCDRDSPETVGRLLRSPPSARRATPHRRRLNAKELTALAGWLRGIPVGELAGACGLSVKSVYRLRQSALSRLGLSRLTDMTGCRP